jgi:hypothetical protein
MFFWQLSASTVTRPAALGAVETAPQCFAIEGDHFRPDRGAPALRPPPEDLGKRLGREQAEDSAERVVRGDAVGQFQKGAQPGALGVAKAV